MAKKSDAQNTAIRTADGHVIVAGDILYYRSSHWYDNVKIDRVEVLDCWRLAKSHGYRPVIRVRYSAGREEAMDASHCLFHSRRKIEALVRSEILEKINDTVAGIEKRQAEVAELRKMHRSLALTGR